jgi:tetratricopeptide (TPR) repeat protein
MQLVELLIRYGDTRNGFENSLREHLKALAVAEKLIAGDPNNTEKLRQFIRANQRIGTDYQRLGDKAGEENKPPDEAGEFFRRALEYHRRMLAATEKLYALAPEKPANRRYLALAYINLSDTLVRNGSADEALEMLGKAQKILEENLRRDPQNSETKFDLAEIFDSFAGTYQSIENHEKFSQYLQKALALSEETYARDPKNLEVLRHIIERTERLMNAHTKMGEHEKAKYFKQKNEEFKAKQSAVKR